MRRFDILCSTFLSLDLGPPKRVIQGADVTILENLTWSDSCSGYDQIHHDMGQIVSSDDLIGKQSSKNRVDPSQYAIAKIWLFSRLHGIDIRRPQDIKARKPGGDQRILGFSLVSGESHSAFSGGVGATPAQE
jgi:hypothetical protein